MINVCSLTIRFDGGGAERVASILAPLFPSNGVNFTRIAIDPPRPGEPEASGNCLFAIRASNPILRTLMGSFRLRRILAGSEFDVLHLNCEAPDVIGLLAWLTLRKSKKPRLIRTEHTMVPWKKYPTLGKFVPKVLDLAGCQTVHCYDDPISTENGVFIPNPVAIEGKLVQQGLGRRLYIVGRLVDSKRVDWIFRAAGNVGLKMPIVVVGDGPERRSLEILAGNLGLQVHFLGYQKNPWKYLGDSDIFISSSSFEGEPLTLLEAVALNVPIILSEIHAHVRIMGSHAGYFTSIENLSIILGGLNATDNLSTVLRATSPVRDAVMERNPIDIASMWAQEYKSILETAKGSHE